MIRFDEEYKVFTLKSGNMYYYMHVDKGGNLIHDHIGKCIGSSDFRFLTVNESEYASLPYDHYSTDSSNNQRWFEIGTFGREDYRNPSIIVERKDGSRFSRFHYVSHEIRDGIVEVKGLPHARKAEETLVVTMNDDFSDTIVRLNYTVFCDCDCIVRNMEIENVGGDEIKVKRASSFMFDLSDREYDLTRLSGAWARERHIDTAPISSGLTKLESQRGKSSFQFNPFMALSRKGANEEEGEVLSFSLIYSGSYYLESETSHEGYLRVQGGIQDKNFSWNLGPSEVFTTPQVAICWSDKGFGQISRSYHDFYRGYIIDPDKVYRKRPIVINNWEATYFDFNNEKLMKLAKDASEIGIDTFVLDDGWFGLRNDDTTSLGDWFVNEDKLNGGLRTINEYVNSIGMKFGLWFEPEMVSEESVLYKTHPEWAIGKVDVPHSRIRNQLMLDFSNPEVVDYIFSMMTKIIDENNIEFIKWDHNREMSEFYSNYLDEKHQGELQHRNILGVYDLADRLIKRYPNIIFEGCAGGGSRFDGGMLYYFPQYWTSDDTDGYERCFIQYGTSMQYPLSAMSCHVSVTPNHQTGRTTPFETRMRIASLGTFGYELDITKLKDEEKEAIRNQIIEYNKTEKLVQRGDLYRILSPFDGKYFAFNVVSKDKSEAYVVIERFLNHTSEAMHFVKLSGLDENKTYYIEELESRVSGSLLVNKGLPIPSLNDFSVASYHIKEVK